MSITKILVKINKNEFNDNNIKMLYTIVMIIKTTFVENILKFLDKILIEINFEDISLNKKYFNINRDVFHIICQMIQLWKALSYLNKP